MWLNTLIIEPKFHQFSTSTECTTERAGQSCAGVTHGVLLFPQLRHCHVQRAIMMRYDEASRAHCKLLLPWAYIELYTPVGLASGCSNCSSPSSYRCPKVSFPGYRLTPFASLPLPSDHTPGHAHNECCDEQLEQANASSTNSKSSPSLPQQGLGCLAACITHGEAISTIATLLRPTGYDNETLRAHNKTTICPASRHPFGIQRLARDHYPRAACKAVCLFHTWLHNQCSLLNGYPWVLSWARLVGINFYTPGTVELRTPRYFDKMLLDSPSLNLEPKHPNRPSWCRKASRISRLKLKPHGFWCSVWGSDATHASKTMCLNMGYTPTFCRLNRVSWRQKTCGTLFSNNPRWRQHMLVCASKQRKGWGLHFEIHWYYHFGSSQLITREFNIFNPVLNQGAITARTFHFHFTFRPWSLWGPCKHKRAVRTGAGTPIRSFENR